MRAPVVQGSKARGGAGPMMKASVFTEYGPPESLHLEEVVRPDPRAGEILIRVRATTVNFGDTLVRDFRGVSPRQFHMPFVFWLIGRLTFGLARPRRTILGSEFSGEVAAVGSGATRFRVGDAVFGYTGSHMGAYAQYLRMPETGIVALKPSTVSDEQAAAIPYGAIMALGLLRKAHLQDGQSVLVNGASGGIGPAVVQLAASQFGARVTAVCGTSGLDQARALGASKVIDHTQQDFTQTGDRYDVVVDILGKSAFERGKGSLNPRGRYLYASFKSKQILQMLWTSIVGGRKVVCVVVNEKREDLLHIAGLVDAGTFRSIVDRTFPLQEAADAHRYAESGMKKGPVVITVP